ncbi:MptD family putative ECF transporter S component [Clostridium ihumii]|uniref:MptD family putative ECF transporter S component n=1 Tax=Clostridium ihumii TaxID=1470356 RepID=UPI0005912756|nr:MptD family putative ECF transporter S component [Clostridium ihumii]
MKNNTTNFGIKDVVTVAVMMVLFFIVATIVGMATVTSPILYLYGTAGIEMFIGAIFYLVCANRINKHGLIFIWSVVYGLINAAMGYTFMLPYFIVVGLIAELSMVGKDTYRNPNRNMIGWSIYGIGMVVGIALPIYVSWENYKKMALEGGFAEATLTMQYEMVTNPALMGIAIIITIVLSVLGVLFAQKLLKKHFKKAGIVG